MPPSGRPSARAGTLPGVSAPPPPAIAGADLPLGALAELARWVEAAEAAEAEPPEAAARIEGALGALRSAWPDLGGAERRLVGSLVTGLTARRPPPGAVPAAPRGDALGDALGRLGVRRLRPGQDRAIAAALAGRDAMVVMATGSGKSLCYQAPAAALSGLTLVVSPLIALMADQVAALDRAGIAAAMLSSDMPEGAQRETLAAARAGRLSMLYAAPERLGSRGFRAALAGVPIALLVVDEAHCVSEWGHEFRPDYRRVGAAREALRPRATMALTATATSAVRADVVDRLGLRDPVEVIGGFDRPNLTFDALWVEGRGAAARRRGVVAAAVRALGGGKAIVYCGTRRAAEETAAALAAEGHAAVAYHAGRGDRAEVQEAFASGRARVVAATNAFGMGVNVPDVRLVAHATLPDSLERLYQEAGRAGRDGEPARHLLVAGPGDEVAARRRIARARAEPEEVDRLLAGLAAGADGEGRFRLPRERADDRTAFLLALAERAGALALDGAPGGGRAGRLLAGRLGPAGREELEGLVRRELRRRHRALDAAVAYARDAGCRRRAFLDHFGDPAEPSPEERCCDRCAPPSDLAAEPAAPPRAAGPRVPEAPLSAAERRLFEALRGWRSEVAAELGWPAFRVASNRTLQGIARARPADPGGLAAVRGVGPWIMEAHAGRILAIVRADQEAAP